MSDHVESINRHYGSQSATERILTALKNAGKNIEALTLDDISTFDQFHIGGLERTNSLAEKAGITKETLALDVGCGIGGPARILASEYNCKVTGLDITKEFCLAAEFLTDKVGMSGKVDFVCGSALDMPFDNETFDMVWLQHATMNIEDKPRLFSEIARVLKQGGTLALHEIIGGSGAPLDYPVPWATDSSISFLIDIEQFKRSITDTGLKQTFWEDFSAEALDWLKGKFDHEQRNQVEAENSELDVGSVLGDDFPLKAKNAYNAFKDGRLIVAQGIFEKGA